MAIDTAEKRGAALACGNPGGVLPFPDATIAAADRAMLAGVYPFAALTTPPVAVGTSTSLRASRRRRR